ncbi:hypothetical protein JJV70_14905 [Streptomyces sp. JJ66]|uniref:RsiG family protein n=1 Tax=Streptomyces sp. JJ66 TaxID=2803843 RepID=UPI001C5702C2|nr:hypothetical protein [Streptomyces sp. JJ66]MBW1603367.1 hypothetical protein [Streptomyces sp. JJ66]
MSTAGAGGTPGTVPAAGGLPPRQRGSRDTPDSEVTDTSVTDSPVTDSEVTGTEDPAALGLPQLRALRRAAQRDEADLSYVRRLLQGRIDILRAELADRTGPATPLVDRLPQILADGPTTRHRSSRHMTVTTPRGAEYRELAATMLAEVELSDLPSRTDGELREAMGRLKRYERQVSQRRLAFQRTADDCGTEIARRYREGEAHVDDLLA